MRIELHGVVKSFGDVVALRDVTATIPAGAKVGIVGPNGSGKSTLLRVLIGVLRAEGSVRLDGLDPLVDHAALAPRMAYVPQIAPQIAAPVNELVRAVASVRGIGVEAVTRTAARLDLRIEDVASRPFRGLSGGTRHKMLIALALAAPASLVILDEPTASLDADARDRFFHLFGEATRSATVVLCSHRIEEMRHMVDHVVAMNEGRLTYQGEAGEYLERRAVALLQVCVSDGVAQPWLAGHGFDRGTHGWWARTVTHAEKMTILPELTERLGGELQDIHIQDLERVEVPGSEADRG